MKKFNWEVLVAALGLIVVLVLAWGGIQSDVGELRGEMYGELRGLRGEVNGLRNEVNGLREDIRVIKSALINRGIQSITSAGDAGEQCDMAGTTAVHTRLALEGILARSRLIPPGQVMRRAVELDAVSVKFNPVGPVYERSARSAGTCFTRLSGNFE